MLPMPRYPIYVPSRGRAAHCYTARCLTKEHQPFTLVVEPQEFDSYREHFPEAQILTLPASNQGLIFARNWIKDHSIAAGAARHWQIDDNIMRALRLWDSHRHRCRMGIALRVTEDFVDRYTNVAVAGLNYEMFVVPVRNIPPPFVKNVHVYSCSLILNSIPHRWRTRYNDDTDLCLQVLADGWCTILVNAFMVKKIRTMKVKGGNTPIYQQDGRLEMARSLERKWPGVVSVDRRYQRPQHVIRRSWRAFDTPLIRKPGLELPSAYDDYGLVLRERPNAAETGQSS